MLKNLAHIGFNAGIYISLGQAHPLGALAIILANLLHSAETWSITKELESISPYQHEKENYIKRQNKK